MGFIAIRGDATEEATLQKAGIDKAQAIIISPGRDDTNALMVLTARNLNRSIRIISSLKKEENRKILKQAGANMIVSPSTVGGYLLADAVDRTYTVDYLYDLMTAGGRVNFIERPVNKDEIGRNQIQTQDGLIVRVHRGKTIIGFWELEGNPLQMGDTVLLISRHNNGEKKNTNT
jgi:voltage-gated potassium channel